MGLQSARDTQGAITTLGSGRCNAAHKLACLVHSWRMELPSWASCAIAAERTCSITSDFGVESHLAGTKVALYDLVPWLQQSDTLGDCTPVANCTIDLTGALSIPGCLHILHNSTADILNHLTHAQAWLKDLIILSRLLSKRWLKTRCTQAMLVDHLESTPRANSSPIAVLSNIVLQSILVKSVLGLSLLWCPTRFLATCFPDSENWTKAHRPVLLRFKHHVHTGRWGSVAAAVRGILQCKSALEHGWNKDAFTYYNPSGKRHKHMEARCEGCF
eukprot:1446674-Amphidinium_carterae.4